MDTSDFYDTAVQALKALQHSIPLGEEGTVREHAEAMISLRDFIRAADEEIYQNNTSAAHRCNNAENNRKDA